MSTYIKKATREAIAAANERATRYTVTVAHPPRVRNYGLVAQVHSFLPSPEPGVAHRFVLRFREDELPLLTNNYISEKIRHYQGE